MKAKNKNTYGDFLPPGTGTINLYTGIEEPIITPSLSDALSNIINSISSVIGTIATAIAANAGIIGTIIVVTPVLVAIMAFGNKIFKGLTGWFK
jgi:hypothetical protein